MFKKGQLLINRRRRHYVEVVSWPLVRIVKHRDSSSSICEGFMYHANPNAHTLIGNNYKAKG